MPTFHVSLTIPLDEFGPNEVEAVDCADAIAKARQRLFRSLDDLVEQTTGPTRLRIVVKDARGKLIANVPAIGGR